MEFCFTVLAVLSKIRTDTINSSHSRPPYLSAHPHTSTLIMRKLLRVYIYPRRVHESGKRVPLTLSIKYQKSKIITSWTGVVTPSFPAPRGVGRQRRADQLLNSLKTSCSIHAARIRVNILELCLNFG